MTERRAIHPPGRAAPRLHCSPAIRRGHYAFVSGQTASDWVRGRPEGTTLPHLGDSTRVEVRAAFANLKATVEAAGLSLMDVARVDNYYTTRHLTSGHFAARDELYPVDPLDKPASTGVMVRRLVPEGCRYAIEAIAVAPEAGPRRPLSTDRVQASPARLSMGIRAGDLVFLSGRMASDYREGLAPEARTPKWMWIGSPIRAQTRYVLDMHAAILESAGLSLRDVVKSEVFLLDPADITGLDEVWADYFPEDPPARSLFVVDGMAVEDGVVEINHVARVPEGSLRRDEIRTAAAAAPLFHEPQAVRAGPLLFLSTRLAGPDARPDPEFPHLGAPGRLEAESILRDVAAICEAAGGSLADVAKVQTYLTDLGQLDAVNEVWKRAFPADPPAWHVVEVAGPLPVAGAMMMCDVIACLDG